jgi:hypothetical protein
MQLIVKIPVADLRKEPRDLLSKDFSFNPQRLSQLIYGENLKLIEDHGEWLYVNEVHYIDIPIPKNYVSVNRDLSFGIFQSEKKGVVRPLYGNNLKNRNFDKEASQNFDLERKTIVHIQGMSEDQNVEIVPTFSKTDYSSCFCINHPFSRSLLLQDARKFLGMPYLWGGKAYYSHDPIASVDCSGLIYLLYRS